MKTVLAIACELARKQGCFDTDELSAALGADGVATPADLDGALCAWVANGALRRIGAGVYGGPKRHAVGRFRFEISAGILAHAMAGRA